MVIMLEEKSLVSGTTAAILSPFVNGWEKLIWWLIVAVVMNDTKGIVYINGVNAGESTTAKGYNYNRNLPVYLGCRHSSSNWTKGKISDFRIYATALSADDIKEIYNTSAYIYNDGTMAALEAAKK